MKSKYDEIMGLPHHVSRTRPQMPMSDRAAQFAPFAALTGYDDAVEETGRWTDDRIELSEGELAALNRKYQVLREYLRSHPEGAPEVIFGYFQPDERKAGGAYLTVTGRVKKLDEYRRRIVLEDGTVLPMADITDVSGEMFASLE